MEVAPAIKKGRHAGKSSVFGLMWPLAVVDKPIDMNDLVTLVGRALERRAAEGADDAMSVLPPRGGCHDAT
jgi:hypothetical protein